MRLDITKPPEATKNSTMAALHLSPGRPRRMGDERVRRPAIMKKARLSLSDIATYREQAI
jgi:hypothetical protein